MATAERKGGSVLLESAASQLSASVHAARPVSCVQLWLCGGSC